jgi:hypothetical protein
LTRHTLIAKLISMVPAQCWIRRAGVALVLLVSLSTGTIALPHEDAGNDTACNQIAVAHDESAHSIGADPARARSETTHCFLCHSLRTFDQAFDRFQQHHDTPLVERLHLTTLDRASALPWTFVPGRAPPV